MDNLLDQPLSKIVLENFQTAQVLENNGLDFCCGGKQTLRTACAAKGIEVAPVLNELNDILSTNDPSANFQHLSLTTLTDYIVESHHAYVRKNIPLILGYLLKIATKHGDRFPHMKKVFLLFIEVRTEMQTHMQKEEEVVFPIIRRLDRHDESNNVPNLNERVALLENEHENAGALMQKIRQLTNNYESPDGACTTFKLALNALKAFEADLHKHVHLENNILFPKAIARFENIKAA